MKNRGTESRRPAGRRTAAAGLAAVVGPMLWMAAPWAQYAVLGDRPYVGTAFDAAAFVGWALTLCGVVGFREALRAEYGRDEPPDVEPAAIESTSNKASSIGSVGVGATTAGGALLGALAARSAAAFVAAGFEAVPATGEDPAGLLLTIAWVTGTSLLLVGTFLVGTALRGRGSEYAGTAALLVFAPAVPVAVVALRVLSLLPPSVGAVVAGTNAVFLPVGVAWMVLGVRLWSRFRSPAEGPTDTRERDA